MATDTVIGVTMIHTIIIPVIIHGVATVMVMVTDMATMMDIIPAVVMDIQIRDMAALQTGMAFLRDGIPITVAGLITVAVLQELTMLQPAQCVRMLIQPVAVAMGEPAGRLIPADLPINRLVHTAAHKAVGKLQHRVPNNHRAAGHIRQAIANPGLIAGQCIMNLVQAPVLTVLQ